MGCLISGNGADRSWNFEERTEKRSKVLMEWGKGLGGTWGSARASGGYVAVLGATRGSNETNKGLKRCRVGNVVYLGLTYRRLGREGGLIVLRRRGQVQGEKGGKREGGPREGGEGLSSFYAVSKRGREVQGGGGT